MRCTIAASLQISDKPQFNPNRSLDPEQISVEKQTSRPIYNHFVRQKLQNSFFSSLYLGIFAHNSRNYANSFASRTSEISNFAAA